MLIEIKKLVIENEGFKRNVFLQKMFINSDSILSIADYDGANTFLLREESNLSSESFSLVKVNQGGKVEDIIVLGAAPKLFSSFNKVASGKKLLNG